MLTVFIILTVINVITSTIKSIVTVKSNKWVASLVSALYYGYYNIVLIYTVADFPLWQKVAVTFACNLVGVFIVKWGEEKARKDHLWKVEATIPTKYAETVDFSLTNLFIPHSFIKISDKHTLFNCYCATQRDSALVKKIINQYDAKYFVSESKNL